MPLAALAAEPYLARVMAVDAERVNLSVANKEGGETRSVALDMPASQLPAGVHAGAWVRVWPASANAAAGVRLTPLGAAAVSGDSTGVRGRLMRGSGRGLGSGRGRR
jgi:hypothetical protein